MAISGETGLNIKNICKSEMGLDQMSEGVKLPLLVSFTRCKCSMETEFGNKSSTLTRSRLHEMSDYRM